MRPDAADMDRNGWPDFWEPIRAVGFPEYLLDRVAIVADKSGELPGAYRDEDNRVLRIGFDGTRIGLRTRIAVPVNPDLAYDLSLFHKDSDMAGGRIRAGVDWLRIDTAASTVLRTDEMTDIGTGQRDWPIAARRMLVNDLPRGANAARLFIIVDREPDSLGGAYHGTVWLDDITLRPLPKILVDAPRPAPDGGRLISVRYSGLFDNLPVPDNPGFFKGKRYHRRVEVTDVFNRPIELGLREHSPIGSDDSADAVEDIFFPPGGYGVYYFNIRLYDANNRLAADVVRSVAVMKETNPESGTAFRSGQPEFGIGSGPIPEPVLASPGLLQRILAQSGARMLKVTPWPAEYERPGGAVSHYQLLADAVRGIRALGVGLTGVIAPPKAMFGDMSLARIMTEDEERFSSILSEAGNWFGLFMDAWQWGGDDDGSLIGGVDAARFERFSAVLAEYAGGLPQGANRRLDGPLSGRIPFRPETVNAFFPASSASEDLWLRVAEAFPWLFEPYYVARGSRYPPARLVALAPPPPTDAIELQSRNSERTGTSITLDLPRVDSRAPNASSERAQLEQLLVRAIHATILSPDTVYLGDLFDVDRGLLRPGDAGRFLLETSARPAFLAAATLSDQLAGVEYLGELGLLPPYQAHVFRRSGTDQAIIALWHNDSAEERLLPRAEIAAGVPISLVDWAGNVSSPPTSIPVRRAPVFVTGLSASLLLTRMSVRIAPEPALFARNRPQPQFLEVVNHMNRQTPLLFRTRFAARHPDGVMENGWSAGPEEMRVNLQPANPDFAPGRLRFTASPDPNSQIQTARPSGADKSGTKIARVSMIVNSAPPAEMLLYLPFRLRSEIDVDIEPLNRTDDPHFVTLQLKIRWFPASVARQSGGIRLLPFQIKMGSMREPGAFPVFVPAQPLEMRGAPTAAFESVELRIPRYPPAKTWVGLEEEGGGNFYLVDVTEYLQTR